MAVCPNIVTSQRIGSFILTQLSQCRNVYTIYLFTLISGTLSGIKYSSRTKMNTQNKEYEPYCFIEEERSQVIGEH